MAWLEILIIILVFIIGNISGRESAYSNPPPGFECTKYAKVTEEDYKVPAIFLCDQWTKKQEKK